MVIHFPRDWARQPENQSALFITDSIGTPKFDHSRYVRSPDQFLICLTYVYRATFNISNRTLKNGGTCMFETWPRNLKTLISGSTTKPEIRPWIFKYQAHFPMPSSDLAPQTASALQRKIKPTPVEKQPCILPYTFDEYKMRRRWYYL